MASSESTTEQEVKGPSETLTWPPSSAHTSIAPPSPAPECGRLADWPSGWRPYACLVGCFFLFFNCWGLVNAYGTFGDFYQQHLMPRQGVFSLNLVGSTQSFLILALSAPVGRLLDAGCGRVLNGVGAALVTSGMLALAFACGNGGYDEGHFALVWLAQGLVVGLGMACFFVSASQLVATWFVRRKAIALGVASSGASVGGVVYPFATQYLIERLGFRPGVLALAGIVGATSLLSFALATPNPAHPRRRPDRWLARENWIDVGAFHETAYVWLVGGVCAVFFGYFAVFFVLDDWAVASGFGRKGAMADPADGDRHNTIRVSYLLPILNGCGALGRLFCGILSQRFGALGVNLVSTTLATTLLSALWTTATRMPPAIAFVAFYGIVSGVLIAVPPAAVAHVLGRADMQRQARLGHWTGMMYTLSAPFALAGPVIAGSLAREGGGPRKYVGAQGWSAVWMGVAALCFAACWACARGLQRRVAPWRLD